MQCWTAGPTYGSVPGQVTQQQSSHEPADIYSGTADLGKARQLCWENLSQLVNPVVYHRAMELHESVACVSG